MAVRIDQVLDYLNTHPICYFAEGMDSLLEMLYTVYTIHNNIDSEEIQKLCDDTEYTLALLSATERERLRVNIGQLCQEHEKLAFIHGFVVGMNLMTEIRTVT